MNRYKNLMSRKHLIVRCGRGIVVVWAVLTASLVACGDGGGPARSLGDIIESDTLVFLTRNSPTTYYEDRDGSMAGIEHDLAVAFAGHLGVEAKFIVIQSVSGILQALAEGKGDVAAAGLTDTPGRSDEFLIGPAYQTVKQLVVCRRDGSRPKKVKDLFNLSLKVPAKSSYDERLEVLKRAHPQLRWEVDDSLDTEQLLDQVWNGQLDCTVADNNIFDINRRYCPELVSRFSLGAPEPLAWLFHRNSRKLKKAAANWFELFDSSGELEQLHEKYYGHIEIFDYVDTRKFVRRIDKVLPIYRPLFESASKTTGLGWTLLAAQAYQESHWKPGARSPTGVEGIMMLTFPAAEDLGVTDRSDPMQSILGGATYLLQMLQRLPEAIEEPERTWVALAAYNVGMSHLFDARELAQRLGKDPNRWKDLAEVLPLLAQPKYYKTLKHGYARGSEPVQYVNRIRDYEDILSRAVD